MSGGSCEKDCQRMSFPSPGAKSMVAVGLRQNQNRGKGWAATTASVDNRNLSFVELYPTLS